jgi:hypothetical protein
MWPHFPRFIIDIIEVKVKQTDVFIYRKVDW